jgi:hypothetical protein
LAFIDFVILLPATGLFLKGSAILSAEFTIFRAEINGVNSAPSIFGKIFSVMKVVLNKN